MKPNKSWNTIASFTLAALFFVCSSSLFAQDGYGYIGDRPEKEIYEVFDQLETFNSDFLPRSVWNNGDLERQERSRIWV